MNCILLYTFDRIKLALNLIQLRTVFYLRYYQEIPSNSFGITKYGIGGSQSVPKLKLLIYTLKLSPPMAIIRSMWYVKYQKNKIWPWSVIHGQLGLVFA